VSQEHEKHPEFANNAETKHNSDNTKYRLETRGQGQAGHNCLGHTPPVVADRLTHLVLVLPGEWQAHVMQQCSYLSEMGSRSTVKISLIMKIKDLPSSLSCSLAFLCLAIVRVCAHALLDLVFQPIVISNSSNICKTGGVQNHLRMVSERLKPNKGILLHYI
jgi:hypothetical protein